jgi:hypothetical protein
MLWPPARGWRNRRAGCSACGEARGLERRTDFRLSFVRAEHVGIKVAWKDLSRGMAAAVLPDVVHVHDMAFPLVPNQTLYAIDAVSLDEAYVDRRDSELDDRRRAARSASPSAPRTAHLPLLRTHGRRACRGPTRERGMGAAGAPLAPRASSRRQARAAHARARRSRGASVRNQRRTSWRRCARSWSGGRWCSLSISATRRTARSSCCVRAAECCSRTK